MMDDMTMWWRYGVVGTFTVIWWLIRQKEAAYEKEIADLETRRKADSELLWQKHDEDSKRLQEFELTVAKQHYVKEELDDRFNRLEASIHTGMLDLKTSFADGMAAQGAKIDKLSEVLLKHMLEETK